MFVIDKDQIPPAGARCSTHPDWPAEIICKKCGTFCCRGCMVEVLPELYYCAQCDPPAVLATRGERFRAHMLDSMLLGVSMFVFLVTAIAVREAEVALFGRVLGSALLLVVLAANGYLVHKYGQSVGKRAAGLRVVDAAGRQASLARIIGLRNAPLCAAAVIAGLAGLGWLVVVVDGLVIFGNEQKCVHDYLAGTRVMKLPQKRSAIA